MTTTNEFCLPPRRAAWTTELPLSQQAASVAAEIAACQVVQEAARRDLAGGDLQAVARLQALQIHEAQLRRRLTDLTSHQAEGDGPCAPTPTAIPSSR